MKYLVNRETKEHRVYVPNYHDLFDAEWHIVEADADGWIPWSGGECPLPDDAPYETKSRAWRKGRLIARMDEPQTNYWAPDGDITAYRPILSETAEKVENHCSEAVTKAINDGILRRFEEARTVKFDTPTPVTAAGILKTAIGHMEERAVTYDKPGGERSMGKTVAMFNALTDHGLSEEQGWLFMVCLKMVRSQQGDYRSDSYEDGPAYFALAGETAAKERGNDET